LLLAILQFALARHVPVTGETSTHLINGLRFMRGETPQRYFLLPDRRYIFSDRRQCIDPKPSIVLCQRPHKFGLSGVCASFRMRAGDGFERLRSQCVTGAG
jgi:hypothetical protein